MVTGSLIFLPGKHDTLSYTAQLLETFEVSMQMGSTVFVWCSSGNPGINHQLRGCRTSLQGSAPCRLQMAALWHKCVGDGRAGARAATKIHLCCSEKQPPYWFSTPDDMSHANHVMSVLVQIRIGDEQMEKVACFLMLTPTAPLNLKSVLGVSKSRKNKDLFVSEY